MNTINIYLFLVLCCMATQQSLAQNKNDWYSYRAGKDELTGYKDQLGKVKIAPRFNGFTQAKVFKNIIAVSDDITNKAYYLLKNGKQVGIDSLYVWDMTYDCEQENKIRFRDRKTDKVGFFSNNGKIIIKANYNDAQPFYNGMALVIYNGKRVCADGNPIDDKNPCEHWYWDGITALIDDQGQVIADSVNIEQLQNINWYSRQSVTHPTDTALHTHIKAKQGGYYSFINYQKEFTHWFYQVFLTQSTGQTHLSTFNVICVEGLFKNTLRKFVSSKTFAGTYHNAMLKKLQLIKARKIETQIMSEQLNGMIYKQPTFKKYFTNCSEANDARFPLFNVITTINNPQGKFDHQEYLSFLRTDNGYKLIAVAWKNMQ